MQTLWKPSRETLHSFLVRDLAVRLGGGVQEIPFADWARTTSPEYQWNAPHLQYIFQVLNRVTTGELKRVMLFMPPRHAKSETVTVRYAAKRLIDDPTMRVIIAAYNHTLAARFSRKVRRFVRMHRPLSLERTAVDDWETGEGGGVRSAGVGGGITGMGANLGIIDDPVKGRDMADSQTFRDHLWDWYNDDFLTRLEPDAAVILIMTRWHIDDLAGRILASDEGADWHVVHLPAVAMENDPLGREPGTALWPERFDVAHFEKIKETRPRTYWSLYQGMPQPEGGATFDKAWWNGKNRYHLHKRDPNEIVARFQFWDTASSPKETSAYSSCTTIDVKADYTIALKETWRQHLTFPQLIRALTAQARRHNTDGKLERIVVEYASSGIGLYQTMVDSLDKDVSGKLWPYMPRDSKEDRAKAAALWCSLDVVELPHPGPNVSWLWAFEDELFQFPQSKKADQVDSFSMGVNFLSNYLSAVLEARGTDIADYQLTG